MYFVKCTLKQNIKNIVIISKLLLVNGEYFHMSFSKVLKIYSYRICSVLNKIWIWGEERCFLTSNPSILCKDVTPFNWWFLELYYFALEKNTIFSLRHSPNVMIFWWICFALALLKMCTLVLEILYIKIWSVLLVL